MTHLFFTHNHTQKHINAHIHIQINLQQPIRNFIETYIKSTDNHKHACEDLCNTCKNTYNRHAFSAAFRGLLVLRILHMCSTSRWFSCISVGLTEEKSGCERILANMTWTSIGCYKTSGRRVNSIWIIMVTSFTRGPCGHASTCQCLKRPTMQDMHCDGQPIVTRWCGRVCILVTIWLQCRLL